MIPVEKILAEMPAEMVLSEKIATFHTAVHLLGKNLPETLAEWQSFRSRNHALVCFIWGFVQKLDEADAMDEHLRARVSTLEAALASERDLSADLHRRLVSDEPNLDSEWVRLDAQES